MPTLKPLPGPVIVEQPDFSDFSEPVISWALELSNSDKRLVPEITINFPVRPEYKKKKVALRDSIEIAVNGLGTVCMYVKSFGTIIHHGSVNYHITLGTAARYLNTKIPGGYTIPKEKPKIKDVLTELVKKAMPGKSVEIKVPSDAPWPSASDTPTISGEQNISDFLDEQLVPAYNWFFDVFGTLWVCAATDESIKMTLKYEDYRELLTNYTYTADDLLGSPDEGFTVPSDPVKKVEFLQVVTTKDKVTMTPKTETIKTANEHNNGVKNLIGHKSRMVLTLVGSHWILPQTAVTLEGWPEQMESSYRLVSLRITVDPNSAPTTSITLNNAANTLPSKSIATAS